jgi:RimJ/RimL family protein N-acetyltransferase
MITAVEANRRIVAMIRLEPFAASHLDGLGALVGDEDILRYTRVPVPVPDGFLDAFLARYEEGTREGTRAAFAIVEDGEFLGFVAAVSIDREAQTAELGYVVGPAARARGVATEGLRRLTEWAFGEGMLRLELLISVDNAASKKVAERCGYVREGVLRNAYVKPGRREDTEIWSRLATD